MIYEKYKNSLGFKNKFMRFVWIFFCIFFYRPFGFPCFNSWRVFVLRLFGAKIGPGCKIHASTKFWAPWNMEVGSFSAIGPNVECYNPGKIIIGDKVTVSQYVYLCAATHDYTSRKYPLVTRPIIIHNWCWVAAGAFISPGVIIHEGAVIGARTVVCKNVDSWTVVAGNPAKFIKKRFFVD